MARAPKGPTNRAAFDAYRRQVEADLRGAAPGMDDPLVADILLIAGWAGRYARRRGAVEGAHGSPGIADRDLAARLAARWRARDAAVAGMPGWGEAFADTLGMTLGNLVRAGQVEAREAAAPHAHGPSLRALWLQAAATGADDAACRAAIRAWATRPPGALPPKSAEAKLAARFALPLRWRETGDPEEPWQAEGEGWRIRLNDFPDEVPYALMQDGRRVGDFFDWPEAWRRGEAADAPLPALPAAAPVALPAAPEAWPQRYAAGEHEAVWDEMVALGPRIREAPFAAPAEAVAQETMRRARRAIGMLLPRLVAEGYRFGQPGAAAAGPRVAMGPGGATMGLGDLFAAARGVDPDKVPKELRGGFARLLGALGAAAGTPRAKAAKPADPLQDRDVFGPPDGDAARLVARLAKRGILLPLSLRFWLEEVGRVDLCGRHPLLCPPAAPGGVLADPLAVIPDADDVAEQMEEQGPDDEPHPLILAYSSADKAAEDIALTDWEDGLAMEIPAAGADAPLTGAAEHPGLVPYLRRALRNGGFPGWDGRPDRPVAEIARLTEGLPGF
jgi:hypothetical protein